MKALSTALLFSLLLCFSCEDDDARIDIPCLTNDLEIGILAYYPFNDGSLVDESLNGQDLFNSTNASPSTDRFNNPDCAFIFDNSTGAPEFLATGQTAFLNNLNQFSVSLWYQPINANRDDGSFEDLILRGDNNRCPNRGGEWSIGLYDCRRAVFGHDNSVWANKVSGNGTTCQDEIEALTDTWHHVVAIKNNDEYQLYFNGNLDAAVNGDANCGTNFIPAQDIGDLFIGLDYQGKIDDILIYNRALAPAEVSRIFTLGDCCL